MAKSKKKHKPNRNQQNRKPAAKRTEQPEKELPNSGRNRAEKRAEAQGYIQRRSSSSKPTWLRVLIIAVMVVMLLAVILPPLLR